MAHLIFKPLRVVQPTYSVGAVADPVAKVGDEHLIISHFFATSDGDGNEACNTFLLSDVVLGETVLAGYTTRGCFELGVVTGYTKGWCFSFDGSNEGSMMWNDFLLLRGPLADAARARYKIYVDYTSDGDGPALPLKRTDSGSNYGFTGHPDLEFWTRSGVQPWLYVMAQDYQHWDETPAQLRSRILEMERDLRETEYTAIQQSALQHQISVLTARLPPPRAATPPPRAPERLVPPPAPRKPTDTFCPVAQDHKHTYGEVHAVGQSWHGPVHAKTCSICDHTCVIDH
jgi:hypothetical protein